MSRPYHIPFIGFKPKPYPVGSVTQFFGENPVLYAGTCAAPNMCLSGHNGWDCVAPWGTPILSVSDGKVVEVKESTDGYGTRVRILGEGYEWVYAHLSVISCSLGQQVKRGDNIGKMGNTGFVVSGPTPYWEYNPFAGTHLHLGRRPVEPAGSSWNVSYPTGDRGNIPNYPGKYLGSVPLGPEDFEDGTPPVQTESLTVQSLRNVVLKLRAEGKAAQAAIVEAIIPVVIAFGG